MTGVNGLAPPANWNNDVIQTGDAFSRIGVNGAGLTTIATAAAQTSLAAAVAALPTASVIVSAYWSSTPNAARLLDSVADNAKTASDLAWLAASGGGGAEDGSSGTSLVVKTPGGTALRNLTLQKVAAANNPWGTDVIVGRS
jgi:hypothetical protein